MSRCRTSSDVGDPSDPADDKLRQEAFVLRPARLAGVQDERSKHQHDGREQRAEEAVQQVVRGRRGDENQEGDAERRPMSVMYAQ